VSRTLRTAILDWYLEHRRDLPWRRSRDPYAIWVSEVMLQQTRVETVIPYYERFLKRFPSVRALARATEADVLAAWSGLGYYSRARNLRRAAETVEREHLGELPRDPATLRALPGIGEYTAAAIASIAFGVPAAAIDGNVIRVLARIDGRRGRRNSSALRREVTERAAALAHGPRPGDWTQALMELGATVCLPRDPLCERCPAARRCLARKSGEPDRYPESAITAAPKPERRVLLVARAGGRVFLMTDPADAHATWTLPYVAVSRGAPLRAARALARIHAAGAALSESPRATFRHRTFSRDTTYDVWETRVAARHAVEAVREGRPVGVAGGRWMSERALSKLPVRAHTQKALRKLSRLK